MAVPVLDPAEFIDRYEKFVKRGVPLGECGELIAQTLLAWATSFGFDESGIDASLFQEDVIKVEEDDPFATIERRKAATNEIVQDILEAIDKNAVARRTSWDGVRVLLLLLPLTTEVLPSADRAVSQPSLLFFHPLTTQLPFAIELESLPFSPTSSLLDFGHRRSFRKALLSGWYHRRDCTSTHCLACHRQRRHYLRLERHEAHFVSLPLLSVVKRLSDNTFYVVTKTTRMLFHSNLLSNRRTTMPRFKLVLSLPI